MAFDPRHFEQEAAAGRPVGPTEAFRRAHVTNHWGATSRSGPGSSLEQTTKISRALPSLLSRLGVRKILDLPCGDFSWMSGVDLAGVFYTGADLVPGLITTNVARHASPSRSFVVLDLTTSSLPTADLLFCRDCLVHLSFAHVQRALRNIARSDVEYMLTTTFPQEPENCDIVTGDWRPIDLTKAPFDLAQPLEVLNEGCTEQDGAFWDKSLGLWHVSQIRGAVGRDVES